MKNYRLIKFANFFVRTPRSGRGSGMLQILCVSLVLLLSVGVSLAPARGGRGGGGGGGGRGGGGGSYGGSGSRGAGFAPSMGMGSQGAGGAGGSAAGAGGGRAGAGAGGVGAAGSGPGTSAGVGGTGAGAGAPGAGALPNGYRAAIPAGTATTYYRGYSCYYADGAYYRPVYYEGAVVYTKVPDDTPALPDGYYYTIPAGFKTVTYQGYTCYYVNGVYYRAVNYNGTFVYMVVP